MLLREGRSVGASKCVRLNVGVLSSPSRGFGRPSSSGTALHIKTEETNGGVSRVLTHPFRLQRRYFRENDLVSAEEKHFFGF